VPRPAPGILAFSGRSSPGDVSSVDLRTIRLIVRLISVRARIASNTMSRIRSGFTRSR
jgi:hypothetical protein